MGRLILLLGFAILSFTSLVRAQKINAVKIIPSIGDTFYRSVVRDQINESYLEQNKYRFWNFNNLSTPFTIAELYESPRKGKYFKYFPEATLVLLKINGEESYYHKKGGELRCVGEVISCSFTKSGFIVGKYSPARLVIPGSFKIGDRYQNNVILSFALGKDEVIGKDNFMPFGSDSIMVKINFVQNATFNDYGWLLINGERHEVMKITSGIYSLLSTQVKASKNAKWKDIRISPTTLPDELQRMISSSQWQETEFFTEKYRGPFFSYIKRNEDITEIIFQNRNLTETEFIKYKDSSILLYPNPTYGDIYLDFLNMPRGDYRMEVYNIIGKKLIYKDFTLSTNSYQQLDLSTLKKGTYIYSITDQNNRKIITRRLSIISL